MDKEKNPIAARNENGGLIYMDIHPVTFMLPAEYSSLVEEANRYPEAIWIMKPTKGA